MSAKPVILCVGSDVMLNRTRCLILEKCFEVSVAHSAEEAIAVLSRYACHLVLLCYSLTDEECRAAIEFIHRLPSPPRILALSQGRDWLPLGPRDEAFSSGGPAELLKKAVAMAGIPPEEAERCKLSA